MVETVPAENHTSFEEITKIASDGKRATLQSSEQCSAAIKSAWNKFTATFQHNNDIYTFEQKTFIDFFHSLLESERLIPADPSNDLSYLVAEQGKDNPEWYTLSAFLLHDIHHLRPSNLFELLRIVDIAGHINGEYRLMDKHKVFLDDVVDKGTWLTQTLTLPFDFVHGVVSLKMGETIPTVPFKPKKTLERIGYFIKGRFANDDYTMLINRGDYRDDIQENRLIIEAPEDLIFNTNEAMLFSVIYNLAKNAAKANISASFERKDQAMPKAYYKGGVLEQPMTLRLSLEEVENNIIMSVSDQGHGLSIDDSLKRIHHELTVRLKENGMEKVRDSEWFWNIRRALGENQSEILMAWPKKATALRDLTVGTIFDCQFVAGFSGTNWDLKTFTSGTGLWGVRYLTERLGGSVIGTNKFEGGSLFSVILPKTSLGL